MEVIEVHSFMPDICSQADNIPLIGDDIKQLIMMEKPSQTGIAISPPATCLNRKGEVPAVAKSKRQEDMCYRVARPV